MNLRFLLIPLLIPLLYCAASCGAKEDVIPPLSDITSDVGLSESTENGIIEDTTDMPSSFTLNNPDFETVRDFILDDPTSRKQFVVNEYECRHFATDVNNNAEALGIRCAMVLICFGGGQHAVVGFDTTDRGLIYIEPQTDAVIHIEAGGAYMGLEITEILIAW